MIVCHCKAVTCSDIRRAIKEGASCPQTVAAKCGAGTGCGACRSVVEGMLESARKPAPVLVQLLGKLTKA